MKYAFLLIITIIIGFIWSIGYGRKSTHTEPRHYETAQVQLPHPLTPSPYKGEGEIHIGHVSTTPLSFIRRGVASPFRSSAERRRGGEVLEPPVSEFFSRITKKPFGIYITPETSPIAHDRWTGYHTGVDIEYEDILGDVPVRAITDGEIVLNRFATGYGGVVVIRHNIRGEDIFALYGHLNPESLLPKNIKKVKQGQIIGILGDGGTDETDGARKHLHFALIKKDTLDIRGYVKSQEELAGWYDPEEFYEAK
jgi:murein DD-endopeptidase MepM/ murein hydrolase activator NlpD